MLIRKNEPLRGPLREHEESRLRDFFSLLEFVRRRRYEPTTTEWLLIQDCLDDVFRRSSDTWFILFAAMAWPLRGRGRRSLTKLLPLYAGFVGWELGLRDRNTMPATDFFSSIIRVDSELGEAARRIYSPLVFGETMALHDRVASGFLPAVAEVLRSMTLENLFRETFAGSLIGVNFPSGGHGYIRIKMNCRHFSVTLFDWKKTIDGSHVLSVGPVESMPCAPSTKAGQVLRSRRLIRDRTQHLARLWWTFTLWSYERRAI